MMMMIMLMITTTTKMHSLWSCHLQTAGDEPWNDRYPYQIGSSLRPLLKGVLVANSVNR